MGEAISMQGDRGGIVLGWLTRLVIVLSILGVIAFDIVALGLARYQAEDRAATAARAAAAEYASNKDVQQAYNAAFSTTTDGDTIETETFSVGSDGVVRLRLHRVATTLIARHIPRVRDWQDAVAEGTARPST